MVINLNNNEEKVDIEELRQETMESMKEYIGNLIPKFTEMITELRSDIKEDSWEYLRMMIDGFNWVIAAYNGTSAIINSDNSIDETKVQEAVDKLSESFIHQEANDVADILEDRIIPFLDCIQKKL